MSLDSFFNPRVVAVVGASNNPKKLGYDVFKNLKSYRGKVIPVNITENVVQGTKAYPSIKDIDEDVDLVIIVVPKTYVKQSLVEAGEKGVKSAVIITAGFSETGSQGLKDELELVNVARKYNMRIIGPNCVGVIDTHTGLNATFIQSPKKGNIAFVSQSGALGAAVIYKIIKEEIGLSKFISLGNMADVEFTETLEYLSQDEKTKSIALYIEGLKKGKEFIEKARETVKNKPVIVMKGGRSRSGVRAVSSHTGSVAGDYIVYKGALKQSRTIIAETIDELLSMSRAFKLPLPRGNRVGVLTNAGGPSVILTDELERKGLELAKLNEETRYALKRILPPMASTLNPVDMIASARWEQYYHTTRLLLEDENVDMVIATCVVPTFGGMSPTEHAEGVIEAWNDTGRTKPVIGLFMSGEISYRARKMLEDNGIPAYERPEDAASASHALYYYSRYRGVHA